MDLNNLCKYGDNYPLLISEENSIKTGLCNPSVLYIDGKLLFNLREVNYILYHAVGAKEYFQEGGRFPSAWGPLSYLHPNNEHLLITRNHLGYLDTGCNLIDTSMLDVDPKWEFHGLEDARLVNWGNKVYITGVRRDTTENGVGRMELSRIIDIKDSPKEISRIRIKHPTDEENAYCEKNWMPVRDVPFTYLKHANPTQVVKVNPENGDCWVVEQKDKVESLPDTRGGSQVLSYKDGYIAFTHDTTFWYFQDRGDGNKDAIYYHRVVFWDKDWNLKAMSKQFHFMDAQIEFCCGAEHVDGKFYITFGFEDNSAHLLVIDEEHIDKLLEDGDYNTK